MKEFILQLEGFLRLLPSQTTRTAEALVEACDELLNCHNGSVDGLLDEFCNAAIYISAAASRPRRRHAAEEASEDDATAGQRQRQELQVEMVSWSSKLAESVKGLSILLQKEIMEDKIYGLINEWCETDKKATPGCCYLDCCVRYDDPYTVAVIPPHPNNNIYVLIAHQLRPSLPDPILASATERLEKFVKQTFWLNEDVFLCCQAAQALAKRGENIDRCFIGESPGGVGQSLYSAHLSAVYGSNHAFIDPNIWFDDHELRKQVEQFAGCLILTAQEAPETSKKMREDLYKKTMSADGIAGRKPYGYVTRMIELIGWKRMEVNKFMAFKGVTEHTFPSILRRSFWWRPRARFVVRDFLEQSYPDAHLDGYFPKDPTLKAFLVSGVAIASSLQLQHGFELSYTRQDCVDMIEKYCVLGGDAGMTEDKMRAACNLPARKRASEPGRVMMPESPPDLSVEEKAQKCVSAFIEFCWQRSSSSCTENMFRQIRFPEMVGVAGRDEAIKLLKDAGRIATIPKRGKGKGHYVPHLVCKEDVEAIVLLDKQPSPSLALPEIWHVDRLEAYLSGHPSHERNRLTISSCLDEIDAQLRKRGAGRKSLDITNKQKQYRDMRDRFHTFEKMCAEFLSAKAEFASQTAASPARRQVGKRPRPVRAAVRYRYAGTVPMRSRLYAVPPAA